MTETGGAGSGPTPLLEARQVGSSYGAISALRDISLTVNPGEAVCVIGPNGAGKTTFARVAGGLYRPRTGEILIDGKTLPRGSHEAVARGVASVLEGRHLFVE
jgi:branched-chain amino acid transport system ATP-binding protein